MIACFSRDPTGGVKILRFNLDQPEFRAIDQPAALDLNRDRPLIYWAPSPDGRWLLTVRRFGQRRLYQVYESGHSLQASWTNRFEGRSQPDWLNDSTGFVDWPIREGRLLARVYWIDTGRAAEVDLDSLLSVPVVTSKPMPQPCVELRFSPLSTEIAAEFLLLSADRNPLNWARGVLNLPRALRHSQKTDITLSPTADRLAWTCEEADLIPLVILSSAPPFLEVQTQIRTSLYVSRPDGSQLALLGRTRPGATFSEVCWSPEGSQLSFVYQNSLWLQHVPDTP